MGLVVVIIVVDLLQLFSTSNQLTLDRLHCHVCDACHVSDLLK